MATLAELVLPEHVEIGSSADSASAVIRSLAALLETTGAVRAGYADACIKREETDPTGLPTAGIAVALPHADPELVHHAAIAVAIPTRPIAFAQMGDPDVELQVGAVFLLALTGAQEQLSALRQVAAFVQDPDRLRSLVAASDTEEILAMFIVHDQETTE